MLVIPALIKMETWRSLELMDQPAQTTWQILDQRETISKTKIQFSGQKYLLHKPDPELGFPALHKAGCSSDHSRNPKCSEVKTRDRKSLEAHRLAGLCS